MPSKFRFTAVDASGNTVNDTLAADSPEHLLSQIHLKGLFCMNYEEINVNNVSVTKLK